MPQYPRSPRNHLSTRFLSLHTVVFLALAFLLTLPFLALLYPFLLCLSLARCPSALTCQRSCAAQGHHRFSVPASAVARRHARLGKTHDLPGPLSGDHGTLLVRAPSQSLHWTACWTSAPLAILYCATFFPGSKHVSKVASLAVHLFPSGTWVENTSQERCCAISTCALALFLEHSPRFQSKSAEDLRKPEIELCPHTS